MPRRLVLPLASILAFAAFAPGCKGMGGLASGLGSVASSAPAPTGDSEPAPPDPAPAPLGPPAPLRGAPPS